jgi:hypothetical protein
MSEYPVWLVERVKEALEDAQYWVALHDAVDDHNIYDVLAVAALDALGFMPDYKAFKRAEKVRSNTDTWHGTATSPDVQAARRKALEEIFRLSDELGES